MKELFIITGAAGHLGGTIVRELEGKACAVRALTLPGEPGEDSENLRYYRGDVTNRESLEPLFQNLDRENYTVYCIHTAGLISIEDKATETMERVNVGGTENILSLCREYDVTRLVYVSSVHALPEVSPVIRETRDFSPEAVTGGYAKTKAMATQRVLAAAAAGLDAVVVHPSGILGPYDSGNNHVVQLIKMYLAGKLPAAVRGGYDFVDVRDVAEGCVSAARQGTRGECYILSNRYITIKDLLECVRALPQEKTLRRKFCLPLPVAKAAVPFAALAARLHAARPLFTRYSLYTLGSKSRFSHAKASRQLAYTPRDLRLTIRDTIGWLKKTPAAAQ